MKENVKRIIEVIVFAAIVLFTYETVSDQFCRNNSVYIRINQVLKSHRDSLDVLFVGSSHVHQAVYPVEMYEKHGFTSGLISSTSQSIPCSYYILEETLKRQHPRVVVMDSFYLTKDTYAISQARIRVLTDAMPLFSPTRLKMIRDLSQKADEGNDEPWTFYYKLGYHHGRWDEMDYGSIRRNEANIECARGAMASFETIDQVRKFRVSDEKTEIPEVPLSYFEKIRELCEKEGAELVVVSIPYSSDKEKYPDTEKEMKVLGSVADYCSAHNIPFLCFMDGTIPVTIDYDRDFHDTGHLNYYGGEKITAYMGEWLDENCDLPDHRNDLDYYDWDQSISKFKEYLQERETAGEDIDE